MSFIVYDRNGPTMARMNYDWSFYRRFDKIWGRDDNLYHNRLVLYNHNTGPIYSEDDKDFTKFLNSLGIEYEDVLGSQMLSDFDDAEVDEYWFELIEPNTQEEDFTVDKALEYIPDFTVGQTFEVEFVYGKNASDFLLPGDNRQIVEVDSITDPNNPKYNENVSMEPYEIRDEIMSDPGMYFIGFKSVMPKFGRGSTVIINDTPFLDNIFSGEKGLQYPFKPCIDCNFSMDGYYWYALFDKSQTNFSIEYIEEPRVYKSSSLDQNDDTNYGIVWRVKYRVIANIDSTSQCINDFIPMFNSKKYANRYAAPLPFNMTQKDYEKEHPLSKYPDFWQDGRLLVQETHDNMKKKDFSLMIAEAFSSDYSIQEPEWWEKLLGVVTIGLSIVVGIFTCCTGTGASLASIGVGLLAGATVASLGALALAAIGGPSTFNMVKNIAGVAQIVSIVGTVFTGISYLKSSWKGIKEYFKTKYDNFLNFFEFDFNPNVPNDTSKIIDNVNQASSFQIEESLEYMINNNLDFSQIFPNANITDPKIKEALDKMLFEKRLNEALAKNMVDLATLIYDNYERNMYMESIREYDQTIQEYKDLIEEMAPGNYDKVLGDAVFAYSLGSYDAISMLDLKVQQSIGVNTIKSDPTHNIT